MSATTKQRLEFVLDLFQVNVSVPIEKYLKNIRNKIPRDTISRQQRHISIIVVNYNTLYMIAHLLYSIYEKIEYEQGNIRIIVVDNGSFDGSWDFLKLLERNALKNLVRLRRHRGHGPALRIGIRAIEKFEKDVSLENKTGTMLTMDSDVIVLKRDLITDSITCLYSKENAAMLGQLQFDNLADRGGYAHPSCLMIKKEIYDLPHVKSFVLSGAPATKLHISLRRKGYRILNFPYRERGYILHLGRGTINMVRAYGLVENPSYECGGKGHHYHGTVDGEPVHRREVASFNDAAGELRYPYGKYIDVLNRLKASKDTFMCE